MIRTLTTEELADRWKISPRTLEAWRARKTGPPYLKLGDVVRYEMAIIEKWEEDHRDDSRENA